MASGHPYRKPGERVSYSTAQTARYLSQHQRHLRANGLTPQILRVSPDEQHHRYASARAAAGYWQVVVRRVEICTTSDTGGGGSTSGVACPADGTSCTVRYLAQFLYPDDFGLAPNQCASYLNFDECFTGEYDRSTTPFKAVFDVYATYRYTYPNPRPTPIHYSLDPNDPQNFDEQIEQISDWVVFSDTCFYHGGGPGDCDDGSGGGGGGGGGDPVCTTEFQVICNCPDKTKKQPALSGSPWASERRDRNWSASRAGTRSHCKHEIASYAAIGLPLPTPNDRPAPLPFTGIPDWLLEEQRFLREWQERAREWDSRINRADRQRQFEADRLERERLKQERLDLLNESFPTSETRLRLAEVERSLYLNGKNIGNVLKFARGLGISLGR